VLLPEAAGPSIAMMEGRFNSRLVLSSMPRPHFSWASSTDHIRVSHLKGPVCALRGAAPPVPTVPNHDSHPHEGKEQPTNPHPCGWQHSSYSTVMRTASLSATVSLSP